MQEYKQVIVVRMDLKMGKGKTAVQVAHASVLGTEEGYSKFKMWYREWKTRGQSKIAVRAKSLEELLYVKDMASKKGLPLAVVEDAGLTQLSPGTITCLCLGPAPSSLINPITGTMKLL